MTTVDLPSVCPSCHADHPLEIRGHSGDGLLRIDVACSCGHRFEIFQKTCKCCRREFDRAGWRALKSKGLMDGLELRGCPCGSTLAIEVKP